MEKKIVGVLVLVIVGLFKAFMRHSGGSVSDMADDMSTVHAEAVSSAYDRAQQHYACQDMTAFYNDQRAMNVILRQYDYEDVILEDLVLTDFKDDPKLKASLVAMCKKDPAQIAVHLAPGL